MEEQRTELKIGKKMLLISLKKLKNKQKYCKKLMKEGMDSFNFSIVVTQTRREIIFK
jgi:hypothetical protein